MNNPLEKGFEEEEISLRIEHEGGRSFKTNERIKIHFTLVMFFDGRKKRGGFFHFFVAFVLLERKSKKKKRSHSEQNQMEGMRPNAVVSIAFVIFFSFFKKKIKGETIVGNKNKNKLKVIKEKYALVVVNV